MDEKLKRVIDLANQLQKAVDDCEGCVDVECKNSNIFTVPAGIHVSSELLNKLKGLKLDYSYDGTDWYVTNDYGVRIFGVLKGENE